MGVMSTPGDAKHAKTPKMRSPRISASTPNEELTALPGVH